MNWDILINFLLSFFIFWIGFKLGKMYAIIKIAKEVAAQITAGNGSEDQLTIEKHNQTYFAYNQEHKFLAQGTTFIELMSNLKARFPGKDFKIQQDQKCLSDEESGQMVKAIFEVFGDRKSAEEKA